MTKEEELDEEIRKLEEIDKKLSSNSYGSPEPISKDSVFKFFRHILDSDDSRKTGNLSSAELGVMRLGVRPYLEIAEYAEVEGLDLVANYLRDKAEIIAATSMSKKGFLAQLFVTQIKKEQKIKKSEEHKKKGWFAKKTGEENE